MAASLLDGSTDQIQVLLGTAAGLCPEVATTMLLTGLPEVTPEAQACVRAFVEANPELVGAAFASGGGDSPATQQFSIQFAAACPEAAGA